MPVPAFVPNWINGAEAPASAGDTFDKFNPATGELLTQGARSKQADILAAVDFAKAAQPAWAATPPVRRGMLLHELVLAMKQHKEQIARIVHLETGKSLVEARGETEGAIACGLFFASEGQRLYGRTCATGVDNRASSTIRQPVGVAGLIIAANTPIANVAWKIFPALVCGNTAILKAAEDTPATAWYVGRLAAACGFPPGVLQIVQGLGAEAGAPLVEHPDVGVVSFTGSSTVGKGIARAAAERMAKVSLELGGKNPLVVCDDADLDNAVRWTALSVFSNAGQRCASASRIIVFDAVYDDFRARLLEHTASLRAGTGDQDFFGPVINERQLANMLAAVQEALDQGATLLAGGNRLEGPDHGNGCYMAATILENASPQARISRDELFGPICCLYRVKDFEEAMAMANDSPYGLTGCIHTASHHRAQEFCRRLQAGVAVVNAGTYGSEPHMPFGGLKLSGNGTREPGSEAVDIYTNLKNLYVHCDPSRV